MADERHLPGFVEERVPASCATGAGWITAEYACFRARRYSAHSARRGVAERQDARTKFNV